MFFFIDSLRKKDWSFAKMKKMFGRGEYYDDSGKKHEMSSLFSSLVIVFVVRLFN